MRFALRLLLAVGLLSGAAISAFAAGPSGRAVTPSTYNVGDPIPAKRIAVMNLNVSGDYSEQVREWLPAMIEECLLKEGWTLVVRGQRMEHIQQERNLPGIKPETRLPDEELLGATTFLELNARIQVKEIQGAIGYKAFTIGDYARASVDLNGQIVDPATGVLKSSISVGGSASGLKTAAVITIGTDWRIGAGGYNLKGVRESLVGKAADVAAGRLLCQLRTVYGPAPRAGYVSTPLQPASTTVKATDAQPTIMLDLPDTSLTKVGDRYGIYRDDKLIAEVEVIRLAAKRAEAKVISQTGPIHPTDVAKKMAVVLRAE